jgi:hypothetical protein
MFNWKIKLLVVSLKVLVAKTNWSAVNRESEINSDSDFRSVQDRSEEKTVGSRLEQKSVVNQNWVIRSLDQKEASPR